jgi:holo-[acyl-carrier protein] synthase
MIIGLGIDLCDINRIEAALRRHGESFARKILSNAEFATFQSRTARWPERGPRYLATRFAAKEAFSKAIGLGMRLPMTWQTCEVAKAASGAPSIVLHGALHDWFTARAWRAHLTLTDEGHMAAAFVVVESSDNRAP